MKDLKEQPESVDGSRASDCSTIVADDSQGTGWNCECGKSYAAGNSEAARRGFVEHALFCKHAQLRLATEYNADLSDDALIYAGSATVEMWQNHVTQMQLAMWPTMDQYERAAVFLQARDKACRGNPPREKR